MKIEQWLNQIVQFDEWGRYGSRAEMFELRELNNDDIKTKYKEYLQEYQGATK